MIVLDTNVLSDVMRQGDASPATAWLDRQRRGTIWTSAVTIYEARFGILRLPAGRKRDTLANALDRMINVVLGGRILPFDEAAAEASAALAAPRRAIGRTIDIRDTQIAGIVLARRASLATRNVRDFADLQVPVIDPWTA